MARASCTTCGAPCESKPSDPRDVDAPRGQRRAPAVPTRGAPSLCAILFHHDPFMCRSTWAGLGSLLWCLSMRSITRLARGRPKDRKRALKNGAWTMSRFAGSEFGGGARFASPTPSSSGSTRNARNQPQRDHQSSRVLVQFAILSVHCFAIFFVCCSSTMFLGRNRRRQTLCLEGYSRSSDLDTAWPPTA